MELVHLTLCAFLFLSQFTVNQNPAPTLLIVLTEGSQKCWQDVLVLVLGILSAFIGRRKIPSLRNELKTTTHPAEIWIR